MRTEKQHGMLGTAQVVKVNPGIDHLQMVGELRKVNNLPEPWCLQI